MIYLEELKILLKELQKRTGASPSIYVSNYEGGEYLECLAIRMTWYRKNGEEEHALEYHFDGFEEQDKNWNAESFLEQQSVKRFIQMIKNVMSNSGQKND